MAVAIETSMGVLWIELYVDDTPMTCKNFIKLCKYKYYNNCVFFNVQKDYIVQTGDPTNTGRGGQSLNGLLYGEQANFFDDEIKPYLRHSEIGTVAMANRGSNMNTSQFYITTGMGLESLDDTHTVFGKVVDGFDVLDKINNVYCDKDGKPMQLIRIRHTVIVFDPYDDPPGFVAPSRSPSPEVDLLPGLLPEDLEMDNEEDEHIEEKLEEKKAHTRAEVLGIIGDIPDADIKPPENVLFICKLNHVTTERSLQILFSQYGEVVSCEIIKDKLSGDSLCYGFIEFSEEESCEQAYFKMNNVLIDERRVHVDFSQSVSRVDWSKEGGWKNYFRKKAEAMQGKSAKKRGREDNSPEPGTNKKRNDNGRDRDTRDVRRDRHNERRDEKDTHKNDRGRDERGSRDHRNDRGRDERGSRDTKYESRRDRSREKYKSRDRSRSNERKDYNRRDYKREDKKRY